MKNVAVLGTGYVGLVSGTCFAEIGNTVYCVDIDKEKIDILNSGKLPIYEPGLDALVKKNVDAGRLFFTTDFDDAVKKSDIIFICVGTPPRENGEADLSYVENAARRIAEVSTTPKIVVEKSTVPVETGARIRQVLEQYNPHNVKFSVVSNPEFLREGTAVEDFLKPDRVVIGTDDLEARRQLQELYAPLNCKILFTDIKSSEIIKHASNSFLATKISFINAVANICEKTGADIEMVAEGMGLDRRIGRNFLNAGLGYGGFCFPKDVDAFINISRKIGYDFRLLQEVQNINRERREMFVEKVGEALWILKGKKIGVLGLAFKPNTDDMRFAPSETIINYLQKQGARVRAFDPAAMARAKKVLNGIEYCDSAMEVVKDAEALLILTEWDEFKGLDLDKVKSEMKNPLIIDGRNLFDPVQMKEKGFRYVCLGRNCN
ncbi:MAG: UDP-glucose/GDP-mannose dehydrogenase family protein [Candidatus Diapherotrites archaeon]|nr:UDP-glucose/GDP-mannose dehydrogenase family protein [Candidatus Diapherotrites archaeon]